MDNIKYLPLGLFFAYSLKLLILGAAIVDAPVLLILAGCSAFYEFKKDKRLDDIKEELKATNARIEAKEKEISELKTFVAGIKMSQQFRR